MLQLDTSDPNEKIGKRGAATPTVFDTDKRVETNRAEWLDDISQETYEVYEKPTKELDSSEKDFELEFSGNKGFHYLTGVIRRHGHRRQEVHFA